MINISIFVDGFVEEIIFRYCMFQVCGKSFNWMGSLLCAVLRLITSLDIMEFFLHGAFSFFIMSPIYEHYGLVASIFLHCAIKCFCALLYSLVSKSMIKDSEN